MSDGAESYVDYDAFLGSDFSASAFANSLVLSTNNPSDHPIDLNTPLSRVLFDVQEVDTHIDNLTRKSALPLLEYTRDNVESSSRILQELETQVAALTEGYERLQRDVSVRHEAADQTRLAAERLWHTVRLCRSVSRCLTLGRQLEAQVREARGSGGSRGDDHRAMVRAANTIVSISAIIDGSDERTTLNRIQVIRTLQSELVDDAERAVVQGAEHIISSFSLSSLTAAGAEQATAARPQHNTYAQTEETRSRAISALLALNLLSSSPAGAGGSRPSRLNIALQEYLRRAISSSLASLTSAFSALPKLDRTLAEVSARCQNVAALEILLESTKAPRHPSIAQDEVESGSKETVPEMNLLEPLLASLDTPSLPSYFWRSMASQLSPRVQKILKDGGVSARTLRSNKERVRDALRECVNRSSQLPASSLNKGKPVGRNNWEREAAVMVQSVVGVIGR